MICRNLFGRLALCVALAFCPQTGAAQTGTPSTGADDAPVLAQAPSDAQAEPAEQSGTLPSVPGGIGGGQQFLGPSPNMQLPAQTAVLVLDVEQAYLSSAWGKRAQTDIEAAAREIEAENTRMEDQLVGEEQALAAERDRLTPAEFRKKAEAFDTRAQDVRRERRQAAVDLGSRAQADRNEFVDAALPVIAAIMQDRSAGVVLDRRQVMAATNAVDITQDLIERMDRDVGDGGQLPELPPSDGREVSDDPASIPPIGATRPPAPPPFLGQPPQPQ